MKGKRDEQNMPGEVLRGKEGASLMVRGKYRSKK